MAQRRAAKVSPDALALFVKLESMEQRSPEFKEGSHELARVLGLVPEW
jgi:hypothetical protein